MPRHCGFCRLPARHDDPLSIHQVNITGQGTITANACRDCLDIPHPDYRKQRPPDFYVPGSYFPICGICGLAMRENDNGSIMRLAPADLGPDSDLKPGAYQCCRDCVELFRPRIYQRLVEHPEQRAFAAMPPLESFGGNWLL